MLQKRFWFVVWLMMGLTLWLFPTACTTGPAQEEIKLPTFLSDEYNEIPTEGRTLCSRGGKYAFFVRKGTVNKVVIDFEGGGACWNAFTCSIKDAIFKDNIDNVRKLLKDGYDKGIYNTKDERNPFKDWYHVFIPYCTGDLHWGDNDVEYTPESGEKFTMHHRGAVNARAALDWVFNNFSKPETIFITGCSAGSYGSIGWSAHIAENYKNSKLYQVGDCGAGIVTRSFMKESFPSWKAEKVIPSWVPGLAPNEFDITEQDLGVLYVNVAKHYSNHIFGQYNTAFDENQLFYFNAMGGGNEEEWNKQMLAMINKIKEGAPNFRSFIAKGKKHCVVPYDEFYTYEVNGTKFHQWVGDLVNGKDVSNMACEGDACKP
ncbi:MAG: pectinesterase [Myxococcales bacterium]|nr:pectinesterase [Myxococcales bacterium]MCB9642927.1 pectinesterase [Myxococcales bacterium]